MVNSKIKRKIYANVLEILKNGMYVNKKKQKNLIYHELFNVKVTLINL